MLHTVLFVATLSPVRDSAQWRAASVLRTSRPPAHPASQSERLQWSARRQPAFRGASFQHAKTYLSLYLLPRTLQGRMHGVDTTRAVYTPGRSLREAQRVCVHAHHGDCACKYHRVQYDGGTNHRQPCGEGQLCRNAQLKPCHSEVCHGHTVYPKRVSGPSYGSSGL
jgi:hypothetical protein